MHLKELLTLALAIGACLCVTSTSAIPVTDINKLPSITVDTLYPKLTKQSDDNSPSESIQYFRNMLVGAQNQLLPQQEAGYVTLFRFPWRLARGVSNTGFGMARGFVDAFAHQLMQSYNHMQKNVIPQASEAFSVWVNPPKPGNLDTPWLDGGV